MRVEEIPILPPQEAIERISLNRRVLIEIERQRYTQMSKQERIARRDKKAFLNDQRKEIEENNRMGKTRGLFRKIKDTKGKFLAKMGTIKDRNGMGLTEVDETKKR